MVVCRMMVGGDGPDGPVIVGAPVCDECCGFFRDEQAKQFLLVFLVFPRTSKPLITCYLAL